MHSLPDLLPLVVSHADPINHAGSLLVAVLLRTAHRNLGRLKDVYLHTNMLAALTNLAPYFEGLAPHASQRLVAFVDTLARRCAS